METVGQIIRARREERGLLLRHVAAQLDIDQAILSKFERGEKDISKEKIVKLAKILSLDSNELMIQFLSDKIAYEIADEEIATEALTAAEKKIKYLRKRKNRS